MSANEWENDQSVQMLLMVTEPDLHRIVHSSDNINSALQNMMAEFSPNIDFFLNTKNNFQILNLSISLTYKHTVVYE